MIWAPGAQAEYRFCEAGEGAGQCSTNKEGIATDFEAHRLYVADKGNNRVDAFEVEGPGTVKFLFAYGWGVATGAEELQRCTASCQQGSAGDGAGQLPSPTWIAVDQESHDVYVTDSRHRVQKFDQEGNFLLMFGAGVNSGTSGNPDLCTAAGAPTDVCGEGTAGTATGQLEDIKGVGVTVTGTVYVLDTNSEGACPEGPEDKYRKRVQKYDSSGEHVGAVTSTDAPCSYPRFFAVDSAGRYWVASEATGIGLRRYPPGGGEAEAGCSKDLGVETRALGVDEEDHLYAAQREAGLPLAVQKTVTKLGTSCGYLRRFGYGKSASRLFGVAPYHSPEGDVFGSEIEDPREIIYLAEPPPGPIAFDPTAAPRSAWARIEARVNPEGKPTTYVVEWVDRHSYDTEGGFASPNTRASEPEELEGTGFTSAPAGADAGCHPFSLAELEAGKCLAPETEYLYRVAASNADGPGEAAEGSFETGEPFVVVSSFAGAVGSATAKLSAQVDPVGSEATGYFEYVSEAEYEASGFAGARQVPDVAGGEAPIDFGAGEGAVKRSVALAGLAPGTSYRFRLAVSDPFTSGVGPTRTLRTYPAEGPLGGCGNEGFREGVAALLPDCRAYEMVSPVDKEGGDIIVPNEVTTGRPAVLAQSATSGERLAYGSGRAFDGADSAPYTSQYIAARGAGGWASHGISPPRETALRGPASSADSEFRHFDASLCESWLTPLAEPPLAEGAQEGYLNLYRRTDELCGGAPGYEAFSTAQPENYAPNAFPASYALELQGISADERTAVFQASDSLEDSEGPTLEEEDLGSKRLLYVKAAGSPLSAPRFVCVLPDESEATACSAGTGEPSSPRFPKMRTASVKGALSADGSRLFWSDATGGEAEIYLRENPLGPGGECAGEASPCTIAVSEAGEATSGTTKSFFWAGSEEGSEALYSTGSLSAGAADLYAFTVAGEATEKIAGQVYGVLGESRDLSRIYLATGEALAGPNVAEERCEEREGEEVCLEAEEGRPNLYLYEAGTEGEEGSYRFIATLAGEDVRAITNNYNQSSATSTEADKHNGQVSGDGAAAAFMSAAPLTGFDNTDASSPVPCGEEGSVGEAVCDNEAFVYDAQANGGEGELLCASCNPAGARPEGTNVGNEAHPMWIAARLAVYETTLYQPRTLREDGARLVFESADPLAARDSNGKIDVYEWERTGTGSCEEGGPGYSAPAHGCVSLLSTGQSQRNSEVLDASASGNDVFFTTLQSLLPYDPGQVDVYDARAGGGLPGPEAAAPGCEGEACQPAEAAPASSTPSSSAFHGPGNLTEAPNPFARCNRSGHRARAYSKRAKSLRRNAARLARKHNPKAARRARAMRRKATRYARGARKQSKHAKRCRARVRKQQRSAR